MKKIVRAHFLERILSSEVLECGEGIVGEVAKTGKAVYVPVAQSDPRIVQHDEPSLILRSLIYSPLVHDDQILGVLVVANQQMVSHSARLIYRL